MVVFGFDMPCDYPLTAFWSKDIGKSGKRGITFDRNSSFSGVPLTLPCQQCIGCRLARSLQWGIRCMHEKQLHSQSSFVTLTYDDDTLPSGGTLVPDHHKLFMYRMREHVRRKAGLKGLRFYMCGEYGAIGKRPHYHYLFFNYDFPDRKFYKTSKSGEKVYTSEFLSGIWTAGHAVVGDVTLESCCYVARYIVDKVTGDRSYEHYSSVDDDGVIVSRVPEFTRMSLKPGIGADWYALYGVHSHKSGDFAVLNGKRVRMPRFYDTRFETVDSRHLAVLKKRRRRQALKHRYDNTVDRRRVRERVRNARMSQFKREIS